jgi:soluble lytic murein transglycosylase-like protein
MPFRDFLLILVFGFLSGLIGFAAAGYADIYKYVDDEGVIHLTNVPTDSNLPYVLLIREKRVHFSTNISQNITKYDSLIMQSCEKYKMDPALIKAVIKAESNFNHQAVSPKGARGLMQLMPATASALQVQDAFHPQSNVEGGVRYLRYLLNLFKGDLQLALAAYNAGEGAVLRYGDIPPFQETRTYVQRVMNYLDQYRMHQ